MKPKFASMAPARTTRPQTGPLLVISAAVAALLAMPEGVASGDKMSCDEAGPQAPRDITNLAGSNPTNFGIAPPAAEMHLCDIHFHRGAEHRASGYTEIAGTGEHRGYVCNDTKPPTQHGEAHGDGKVCGGIAAGDTVEVHWVFTTCDVEPGPTLASCFTDTCKDPQLRVEARVFHLTDDGSGLDFSSYKASDSGDLTLPEATDPVQYIGSTTGPSYNDGSCSPYHVTWNVSSVCSPLEIASLNDWCEKGHNPFAEDHAHGDRELVINPDLLSTIK